MRAVKGSVVSSRPISLSKAAAILARFAGAETGARPEIAAYLRRASTAFDELVQFHREIKAVRSGTKRDAPRKEEEDGGSGDGLKGEKKRRRQKKKEKAGMEEGELPGKIGVVDGRDSMEDEGNSRGGVGLELEGMKEAKRKKKKRRREAEEEDKNNLERKEEEVEQERHAKRRKKKKDKGEREEEVAGDGLDGVGRDGDRKERRGLENEIEWHKKKNKKERRKIEEED